MIFLLLPFRLKQISGVAALAVALWGVTLDAADGRAQCVSGWIVAGWFYAHLLGFGPRLDPSACASERPPTGTISSDDSGSVYLRRSRSDPRIRFPAGFASLTWSERRTLARAQEKIGKKRKQANCPARFGRKQGLSSLKAALHFGQDRVIPIKAAFHFGSFIIFLAEQKQ